MPFWRQGLLWLGLAILSPFVLIGEILSGRSRLREPWIRGYLLLGSILLVLTGLTLALGRASDRVVFATLGRFDAARVRMAPTDLYADEINAAASRHNLNPILVSYLIQIESGGRPLLVSPKGARGLMQIMPQTWREVNPGAACPGDHAPPVCSAGLGCIFSAWGNIRTGTEYFARLIRLNRGDLLAALQAYNAGQMNVAQAPPAKFRETQNYLRSFLQLCRGLQQDSFADALRSSVFYRRFVLPIFLVLAVHLALGALYLWRTMTARSRFT